VDAWRTFRSRGGGGQVKLCGGGGGGGVERLSYGGGAVESGRESDGGAMESGEGERTSRVGFRGFPMVGPGRQGESG